MPTKEREKDFPATSIGRSSGARLTQESHPLGPNALLEASSAFAQKYRPYTPRTRVVPSPAIASSQTTVPPAVTPGTLFHPPSQRHQPAGSADATIQLQLANAKAEAQNVGLNTNPAGSEGPSIGWAMLEKVVSESETGEVWGEVWNAITAGKAMMLLPIEPLSSAEILTPEFVKDHIIFYDSSSSLSSKPAPIITLSGLRGTLDGNTITFYSVLHPSSPFFQSLQDPTSRIVTFRKLPPLTHKFLSLEFPSFTRTTPLTTLPLPPKPQTPKPPLPPRPGARPLSTINTTSAHTPPTPSASSHSRIPNPFASLFGNRPSTPTPAPAPPPSSITLLPATSPSASIRSLEPPSSQAQGEVDPHAVIEVQAVVLERKVSRTDVGKGINERLRHEIKTSLSSCYEGDRTEVPEWVFDRVLELCEPWFPFGRAPKTISSSKATGERDKEEKDDWVVNTTEVDNIEDTVDFVQDFYAQLEDYLRVEIVDDVAPAVSNGEEKAATVDSELKIRNIMEVVEKTVCSLFYDRLFAQTQTDDTSHDSTLSNRIAALNLLDLTLEHLDIAVESGSKAEVESVVRACGTKLCALDSARSPKEKAKILVEAHQVVVDGLSKLPPVRLMSAEESKALKEQQASLLKNKNNTNEGPALVIQESSPRPSIQGEAEAQLSPLSLSTTSELPFTEEPISVPPTPSPSQLESNSSATPTTNSMESEPQTRKPTPVSSDVLLPMLIFSTVKSNPPHLVSNLLYIQRFRRRNIAYVQTGEGVSGGEESFCLVNMLVVAEFLENVDLDGLGLGTGVGLSAAELTPIITRSPKTPTTPTAAAPTPKSSSSSIREGIEALQFSNYSFRGKVEQQVDAIAGSANKVISGVVDSSFGILRSILPQNLPQIYATSAPHSIPARVDAVTDGAELVDNVVDVRGDANGTSVLTGRKGQRPGLLKREKTGFSIASIAASIAGPGSLSLKSRQQGQDEGGQQLVDVHSRPGSIRSARSVRGGVGEGNNDEESEQNESNGEDGEIESDDDDDDESDDGSSDSGSEEDEGEDDDDGELYRKGGLDIPGIQVNPSNHHHPYGNPGSGITRNASTSAGSFGTDTRSIRSFESMLSDSKKRQKEKKLKKLKKENERERKKEERIRKAKEKEMMKAEGKNTLVSASKTSSLPRKSLTDRLASVGALAGGNKSSPPDSRRSSIVPHFPLTVPTVIDGSQSPSSSRAASPSLPLSRSPSQLPPSHLTPLSSSAAPALAGIPDFITTSDLSLKTPSAAMASGLSLNCTPNIKLAPPKKRFMECRVDELSIGEVGELLIEYRRLVEGVKELGAFSSASVE